MCFSATANFVGSGVLGAVGVVTLTKVKHRREVLFASLPVLFAIHQFIEGFVWLGLDGILSPAVAHDMGAAFMLYAQGLLPFLLPLSVMLFEPNRESRGACCHSCPRRGNDALYPMGADGIPIAAVYQRETVSSTSIRRPTIRRWHSSMWLQLVALCFSRRSR